LNQTIDCFFVSIETSPSPKITDYFPKKENLVVLDSDSSNESKQKDETVQKNEEQTNKEVQSKLTKMKNDDTHHLIIEIDSINNQQQQQTHSNLNDKEVKVGNNKNDEASEMIVSCYNNDPVFVNNQITSKTTSTLSSINSNDTKQKLTEERTSKHPKNKTGKERKRKFLPELRIGKYSSTISTHFPLYHRENSLLCISNNSISIKSGQRSK
jgi:hypothetical protein